MGRLLLFCFGLLLWSRLLFLGDLLLLLSLLLHGLSNRLWDLLRDDSLLGDNLLGYHLLRLLNKHLRLLRNLGVRLVKMSGRGACMVRHRCVSLVNRIAELVIVLHRLNLCVSKVWWWQNLRLRLLDRNDWLLLTGNHWLLVAVFLKRH